MHSRLLVWLSALLLVSTYLQPVMEWVLSSVKEH